MNKDSKIYIAGHRGMVGSAILRKLTAAGFQNIICKTSAELDLRNQSDVMQFFEKEKPAYVFLAAAKVGGIVANNTYRADFLYENLAIQNNIIHASHINQVSKLLFLGSSCIYPKLAPQPLKEESLLTGLLEYTNEPYAIAKIAGIKMCEAYRSQYGCNFIAVMPTKIVLLDDEGNEVGMSTEDFAEYRTEIGKEPFEYNGHTVTGFAEDAFRYFRTLGDKQFIVDSMTAKPGPAWDDFVEAINNGSIFSIVTARGHHPNTLKEACYNYIVSNHNGIDSNELVKNLEKYRDLADEEQLSKKDMIREYLDMCRFYPVSYGEGSATNPEEGKIKALKEFIQYVRDLSQHIHKKAYLKNKVSNNFVIPSIGFSDDDPRNVEKVKSHFDQEPDNILKTYSTAGGVKKLQN